MIAIATIPVERSGILAPSCQPGARTSVHDPSSYDRVLRAARAGAVAKSAQARSELTGCPWHDVKAMLRDVGLRPTRQRMALGWILFAKGDRHLTAEMLYEEATKAKVPVSLATVYNTLHQFTEVGLLRQVAVDGSKTYFDTNVVRPPSLLRRRRQRAGRHPERRSDASTSCRPRRPATRSPASTWWCGCARRTDAAASASRLFASKAVRHARGISFALGDVCVGVRRRRASSTFSFG